MNFRKGGKNRPDIKAIYKTIDGLELPLFVYMPKIKMDSYTAIITIHGGGWHTGVKDNTEWDGNMMAHQAKYYADKGFVGIAFSYRSIDIDGVDVHDIVDDCKDAIKYINSNFQFIDKKILIGDSAGGHLATMLGISDCDAIRPYAVIACNPVLDCTDKFLYAAESEISRRNASPLKMYIEKSAKFLFMHGDKDQVVDINDSIQMCKKLQDSGFDAEMITINGAEHAFILFDYKSTDEEVLNYMRMIDEYLISIGEG